MATKKYKPTTPGSRKKSTVLYNEITTSSPNKSLVKKLNRKNGRNNSGKITVRHKGGGVKRKFRVIDFQRKKDVPGKVESIEYDPNRSAFIALVNYIDGEKKYILAPNGIKVGDKIETSNDTDINIGKVLNLSDIPTGSLIHNIELTPGKGGQLVRSAGTSAVLMAKFNKYATIKLPSGEIRLVLLTCKATYGRLSNESHNNINLGKAGTSRHKNIRPTVRGSVMNACDHKHGGGEGRAPIGLPGPCTAYGKRANKKTRGKRKSNRHLVRARKR